MPGATPIIVIKKKGGHGGHHGGAWKVAYADFVTAMMALFIVLWLMNTSKPIQQAVAGYFKDPSGASHKLNMVTSGGKSLLEKDVMAQLKEQLEKAISRVPNFDKLKSHIEMTITPEGLRIELLETDKGTFFDSGSRTLNTDGRDIVTALAAQLGALPNKVSIEGHTDAKPYAQGSNYGNWELSADRANSTRRLMQANGVRPDQITEVMGFADQRLRKLDAPLDPSNRRVALIVHYLDKKSGEKGKNQNEGNSLPQLQALPGKPAQSKPSE